MTEQEAVRLNISLARATWGRLPRVARGGLRELTTRYTLSVALGDVQFIDGRWYVTNAGLLRLAARSRCNGMIRPNLQCTYVRSSRGQD